MGALASRAFEVALENETLTPRILVDRWIESHEIEASTPEHALEFFVSLAIEYKINRKERELHGIVHQCVDVGMLFHRSDLHHRNPRFSGNDFRLGDLLINFHEHLYKYKIKPTTSLQQDISKLAKCSRDSSICATFPHMLVSIDSASTQYPTCRIARMRTGSTSGWVRSEYYDATTSKEWFIIFHDVTKGHNCKGMKLLRMHLYLRICFRFIITRKRNLYFLHRLV